MYGTDTLSWRRSTENRQMKRERAEFTKRYEAGEVELPKTDPRIFMVCTCLSFRNPHTIDAHKKLRADHDWRGFQQREREEVNEYREWGAIR